MTMLWFVRHTTTAHTGKKLSGWMEGIPLTEEGKAQAEATADMLAHTPFDAVYSSPLDRTLQTARVIAKRHGLNVKVAPGIGEVGYGKWTNRSMKVLARTKLWAKVQQWPSAARFPEGESIYEVQSRAVNEVQRLAEAHEKQTLCLVSHADVIKLVFAHYLGVHIDLYQRIAIAPGSASAVAIADRGPMVLALNVVPKMFAEATEDE